MEWRRKTFHLKHWLGLRERLPFSINKFQTLRKSIQRLNILIFFIITFTTKQKLKEL